MTWRSLSKPLILISVFLPAVVAQQYKGGMPMIAGAAVPLYPPLARATRVQGTVHVKIETDGRTVVTAQAEDGHRLLALAAEENAGTWQFAEHEPTSFTVTYRYRIDVDGDPNNPTVTLRFPTEVEVSTAPLVISDPPGEIKK